MTDVRARIAEALTQHFNQYCGTCIDIIATGRFDGLPNHLTDVLLALDGIKFVALPEQSWPNDFGTSFDCEVMATETGRVLSDLDDYSPDYARALAAALLAAADAAEQATK